MNHYRGHLAKTHQLLNITEKSVYPHSCWCFFIDMEKYKQSKSVQNILPEQEYWLKKHQINDKGSL